MAENINDTNLTMEEYSTQYFGFTPKSFCNGVYNAMNEYLSECIKAVMDFMTFETEEAMNSDFLKRDYLDKHIKKSSYADLLSADQIETGISKILAQYSEVFDQNFDRFELYMYKNIFNIPSHVLLPEDEVQTVVRTQSEEELLDDEITILEMKIWAVKIAIARLREELLDLEVSQKQLDSTLAKLNELRNLMAEAGVSHPHEALLATAENIAKCKRLIAKITKDSSLSSPVDTISTFTEFFLSLLNCDDLARNSKRVRTCLACVANPARNMAACEDAFYARRSRSERDCVTTHANFGSVGVP